MKLKLKFNVISDSTTAICSTCAWEVGKLKQDDGDRRANSEGPATLLQEALVKDTERTKLAALHIDAQSSLHSGVIKMVQIHQYG